MMERVCTRLAWCMALGSILGMRGERPGIKIGRGEPSEVIIPAKMPQETLPVTVGLRLGLKGEEGRSKVPPQSGLQSYRVLRDS